MNSERFVLIMAGGEGERFWPYSTPDFPKQFLALFDNETMIEKTFNRMKQLVPKENIFVSTNKRFLYLTRKFLPDLPKGNIITEPEKRNTFPAMALFLATLKKRGIKGSVIMVAADHIIEDEKKYLETCENALKIASDSNKIVTFGIVPTRVETNYGYLLPKSSIHKDDIDIFEDIRFIEKPNYIKAKEFYESGNYYWNSGIFTFNINTLLSEIKAIVPKDYEIINHYIVDNMTLNDFFSQLTKNSIDFVIMERSKNIFMLKADFFWDDIGNWDALLRFTDNNFIKGDINFKELEHSVIMSNNYKITGDKFHELVFIEINNNILISDIKGLKYIKKGLKNKRDSKKLIYLEECSNIKLNNFTLNALLLNLNDIIISLNDNEIRFISKKVDKSI